MFRQGTPPRGRLALGSRGQFPAVSPPPLPVGFRGGSRVEPRLVFCPGGDLPAARGAGAAAAPAPEADPGGRGLPGEMGRGPKPHRLPRRPSSPHCASVPSGCTDTRTPTPRRSKARFKRASLRFLPAPHHRAREEEAGTSKVLMALQRTCSLLLLLLLTLLGLGLVQPSYGQDRMYQRFLRQHVDPEETGGNDRYCNLMMQRRKMTTHQCKRFNTFIHEDIWNIRSICSTTNIQCKNGKMNCHEGVVKVTDCKETGSSRAPNCRYRAMASTRRVIIACEGNPEVPVHFDK
ncbi:ribonuclease 4 isoform X2 [Eulemur rufifrons]|uniref:ribonuclease 4 isoform X2 n=2 Tax=Eulemur rufifrons TaxID=859984 RepID=UPI003743BF99